MPNFELVGYDDRTEKAVLTRLQCQEICLKDKTLPCRSAEYDYTNFICRLSRETRRSQPAAYRATTEDIDYLENQCADARSLGMCDYQEYPGQDLGFGDLQITARSKDEVKSGYTDSHNIIHLHYSMNIYLKKTINYVYKVIFLIYFIKFKITIINLKKLLKKVFSPHAICLIIFQF